MIAGKAMPNAERQRAPNSEINSSKFGMATANKTTTKKERKKNLKGIFVCAGETKLFYFEFGATFGTQINGMKMNI